MFFVLRTEIPWRDDADSFRSRLRQQGTSVCIPPRRNRKRRALFTAAITGAATTSKNSFYASSATAESALGMTNLRKPSSASFNSPRSSIG